MAVNRMIPGPADIVRQGGLFLQHLGFRQPGGRDAIGAQHRIEALVLAQQCPLFKDQQDPLWFPLAGYRLVLE